MAIRRLIAALALVVSGIAASEPARVVLGAFSQGDTEDWRAEAFDDIPASEYEVVSIDGRTALHGRCRDSASAYGIEREIDLTQTPILHWSWRVDQPYTGLDERRRSGDDFPARVYAIIDGGWRIWRTRAVNYVWAGEVAKDTAWPNPFQERAMMVAVQSGPQAGWVSESRNVRADFQQYFGIEADTIDGIAVMVDCDSHGGPGEAYFGDIYFSE